MSSDFLEKDVIIINSLNRMSGTSSNFNIDISKQLRSGVAYDSVSLLKFSCPKSYYLISSTNNTFYVTEGSTTTTITIDTGNYTFSTMATELTTLLASCLWTYTVIADKSTGKFIFQVSGNTGTPSFNFSGDSSPYSVLGFDKAVYSFASNKLISPNIVNFQKTSTIQLACDFVDRNIISNIVSTNQQDFGYITYVEPSPQYASRAISKPSITTANFYIIDGNTGKQLDLNGLTYNFTLAFYKKNTYYNDMLQMQSIETDAMLQHLEQEKNKAMAELNTTLQNMKN